MKEKYVKLESVLTALYSNKRIGDNGDIDPKAITDILALPVEEIETNQEPNVINVINDKEYDLLKLLKDKVDDPYDTKWTLLNVNTYIPEPCKACPNHPSNGGSGICNCTLGSPVTYVGN